nr:MAG TPA: hypothetical protein [Caudoviricetes sp.]
MILYRLPLNALQKGLYTLINGAIVTDSDNPVPVYDFIPTGQEEFPYIWLGRQEDKPDLINKVQALHLITQEMDVWSTEAGKRECNEIMDDLVHLLTIRRPEMSAFNVLAVDLIDSSIEGEAYENGITAYHGKVVFSFLIEQKE